MCLDDECRPTCTRQDNCSFGFLGLSPPDVHTCTPPPFVVCVSSASMKALLALLLLALLAVAAQANAPAAAAAAAPAPAAAPAAAATKPSDPENLNSGEKRETKERNA